MRRSEIVVLGYLAFLVALAWTMRLSPRRRAIVTVVSVLDAAAIWVMASGSSAFASVVRDWFPVVHILIGYWLSGAFFRAPMPAIEAWLARGDRWIFDRLGVDGFVRRGPRAILELLEAAYFSVYVLIPCGFALALYLAPDLDVDRYWTRVILAEFMAYAALPFIQTRTPRALGDHPAIETRALVMRRLSMWVTRRGSIQVNTVPSGHAAGAVAVALAISALSPTIGAAFLILAAAIIAGSVVGRYHFAIDGLLGAAVALAAWSLS